MNHIYTTRSDSRTSTSTQKHTQFSHTVSKQATVQLTGALTSFNSSKNQLVSIQLTKKN